MGFGGQAEELLRWDVMARTGYCTLQSQAMRPPRKGGLCASRSSRGARMERPISVCQRETGQLPTSRARARSVPYRHRSVSLDRAEFAPVCFNGHERANFGQRRFS